MEKRVEVGTGRRLGPKVLGCALAIVVVALACQDTTGVHWVDSLSLKPDSLYLVPGESLQFDVVPLDQHDLPLPERAGRVEWNLSNPDVAVIETTETGATITGVAPGGTYVRVELGRGSAIGSVYVEPFELSEIRIEPSPVEVNYRSRRVTVRGILIGPDGNEVPPTDFRASWRIGDIQTFIMVGGQEVITGISNSVWGRNRGTAALTLVVGDRKVTTSVIVR